MTEAPNLAPHHFAERIEAASKSLLGSWKKRAQKEIIGLRDRPDLVSHRMPLFLNALLAYFREPLSQEMKHSLFLIAREYGESRYGVENYRLRDLGSEFSYFRQTLVEYIHSHKIVASQSIREMHSLIDEAILTATEAYHTQGLSSRVDSDMQLHMQQFFLQSPEPMVMMSGPRHVFVLANEPYLKLVGRNPIGLAICDAFRPEEIGNFAPLVDQVYQSGIPYQGKEILFTSLDATGVYQEHWLDVGYYPTRDKNGQVNGVLAAIHDVTDQVSLRQELETSKSQILFERQKMERLFEATPAAMAFWVGESLVFDKVNPSYQAMFPGRQLVGKTLLEICPELIGQQEILLDVLRTGKTFYGKEVLAMIAPSAEAEPEPRYYDFSYVQIKDADGKPFGVYDHAVDVTERVLARRRMEQYQSRVQKYAEAMPQMAFVANSEGRVTYVNRRFYDYAGLPVIDIYSMVPEIIDLYHPEDFENAVKAWEVAVQTGEPYQVEARLRRADGTYRWHLGRAVPERDAQGRITEWFGTNTDIHEQKLFAQELTEAKRQAEAANEAKSSFLANMSHEIRTPLGAIMGFVDLMKYASLSREELLNYICVIERNSNQLLRIIDDILDLAKVEAGKMLIEKIVVSVSETLSDFNSVMSTRAKDRGIEFCIEAETPIPETIVSDPTRLRQILTNVVGNALKFTQDGSVKMSLAVVGDKLEISVMDTGRGISSEQAKYLFQPFMQADVSTTRTFGGTGLGLALTKRLATALGGDFWLVKSEIGEGSTFKVSIALEIPPGARMLKSAELSFGSQCELKETHPSLKLRNMNILVVEDSPDNRDLIGILLRRSGAAVEFAGDGDEGVKKALAGQYDLVLMDIQMPKKDGYQALAELRAHQFKSPVIALTAHAMREERERAGRNGFTDFATKPIQREAFLDLIAMYSRA